MLLNKVPGASRLLWAGKSKGRIAGGSIAGGYILCRKSETFSRQAVLSIRPRPPPPVRFIVRFSREPAKHPNTPNASGELAEAAFVVKAVDLGFAVSKPWGEPESRMNS
jgi:hypothetical protein